MKGGQSGKYALISLKDNGLNCGKMTRHTIKFEQAI